MKLTGLKTKLSASALFLVVLLATISSCTKDSAPPLFGDYPTDIGKIFTYKCATSGCHNESSADGAAGLSLTSYSSLFKGSVNGSPVIPYRSDFSSLCYFINTFDDLGPKNLPTMPVNSNPLSRSEVETIKAWIDNGAPDINGNIMWADNPNRKKYYVLNQGCDVVTVFDAATQLPMRYINVGNKPGGESPHQIKVSPDGQYWYVVFYANSILQKYRTSDDSFVGTMTLGNGTEKQWNTLTITNDGKKGYCMAWPSGTIAVVDLDAMSMIHFYINAFPTGHGTALNATEDTLYVTAQTGNFIYKTDTSIANSTIQISLQTGVMPNPTSSLDPHEITFSPDGTKYFVTCQNSKEVRVMRTKGDSLLQVITTGTFPQEFAKSVSRNKLYVSCQEDLSGGSGVRGSVTVIDMNTFSASNHPVGYLTHGIALDETNGFVIVASRNILASGPTPHHTGICGRNGFVSYFDINTMELKSKKTEVASDPYSVSLRP